MICATFSSCLSREAIPGTRRAEPDDEPDIPRLLDRWFVAQTQIWNRPAFAPATSVASGYAVTHVPGGIRVGREGVMKLLDHGYRRSHRTGDSQSVLVWDEALSERFERLYDQMIDSELRLRRRVRHRRMLDAE